MTKAEALRLMVAARDDLVVAGLVYVLHEHRLPANSDVHPFDHWDAIQDIANHGIGIEQLFAVEELMACAWTPPPPALSDVQDALQNLRILLYQEGTPMTTKARPPLDAFTNSSALAPRNGSNGLAAASAVPALARRRAPESLDAFAPTREIDTHESPMRGSPILGAFAPRGLDCVTDNEDAGPALNCQLICRGGVGRAEHEPTELRITTDNEEVLGPENLPAGMDQLIEFQFHGECPLCGTAFHFSADRHYSDEHGR